MRLRPFPIALAVLGLLAVGCSGGSKPSAKADDKLVASGPAPVASKSAPGEALLRVTAQEGDEYITEMEMTGTLDGSAMQPPPNMAEKDVAKLRGDNRFTVKAQINRKFTKVAANAFTFEETTKSAEATGVGIFEAQKEKLRDSVLQTRSTRIVDSRGRPLGDKDLSEASPFSVIFPEKPVKPGDVWKDTIMIDGTPQNVEYKLIAFEDIEGRPTAKVSSELSSPQLRSDTPVLTWIELSTGRPLRGEATISKEQDGLKMKMQFVMSVRP